MAGVRGCRDAGVERRVHGGRGGVGVPGRWPDVVAVVPARNEAEMLPATLPALLGQEYPGALSVILVDDGSSDGTAEVAAQLGRGSTRTLRVVAGTPPPKAPEPPEAAEPPEP